MQIAPCHQGVMEHVGVNQSMAPSPFFGTLWCARELYGATSHRRSICKSSQICSAGPQPLIWRTQCLSLVTTF